MKNCKLGTAVTVVDEENAGSATGRTTPLKKGNLSSSAATTKSTTTTTQLINIYLFCCLFNVPKQKVVFLAWVYIMIKWEICEKLQRAISTGYVCVCAQCVRVFVLSVFKCCVLEGVGRTTPFSLCTKGIKINWNDFLPWDTKVNFVAVVVVVAVAIESWLKRDRKKKIYRNCFLNVLCIRSCVWPIIAAYSDKQK